jgi:hypothetical protein
MKKTWIDLVVGACSEFEMNNPGGLQKIKEQIPNVETLASLDGSEEIVKLYLKAAQSIVEPGCGELFGEQTGDTYEQNKEELDFYYEKCESEGMGFIKGGIACMDNHEAWHHIIDLVDAYGY